MYTWLKRSPYWFYKRKLEPKWEVIRKAIRAHRESFKDQTQ